MTKLLVRESNQHIFVTTGSYSWPSGDLGGVRRSDDQGASWDNLVDCYIARTIIDAPDGNLYASIWPYPSNEGLYRSTDNGETWGSPLTTVPSGNNIFSITLNMTTAPPTILIGTRTGVQRSLNGGGSWQYANNGIPAGSWVRDLAAADDGTLAAATTNGLFISSNNGDSWLESTGITPGQYPVILDFEMERGQERLISLTQEAELYEALSHSTYLQCVFLATFIGEGSGLSNRYVGALGKLNVLATFSAGLPNEGCAYSWDGWDSFIVNNAGLPGPAIPASSLAIFGITRGAQVYLGLFENSNGGAKVFTISLENPAGVGSESAHATECILRQNYPNPFGPGTTIEFALPTRKHVTLELVDATGRIISTLVEDVFAAGNHRVTLNSAGLNSGVYCYRLHSGSAVITRKLELVR